MKTKVIVCVRCGQWTVGCMKMTEQEKIAILALIPINIFEIDFENEVCNPCRLNVGDHIAELLLKFNSK